MRFRCILFIVLMLVLCSAANARVITTNGDGDGEYHSYYDAYYEYVPDLGDNYPPHDGWWPHVSEDETTNTIGTSINVGGTYMLGEPPPGYSVIPGLVFYKVESFRFCTRIYRYEIPRLFEC